MSNTIRMITAETAPTAVLTFGEELSLVAVEMEGDTTVKAPAVN